MTEAEHTSHAELPQPADPPAHTCGGGAADENPPALDARLVPHAIRPATILGALDSIAPGAAMILVAPHDPVPLLAQIHDRWPGRFRTDYLESGPEAWRLRFVAD